MNYTDPATSFDNVIQHLRNKNLAVFPASRGSWVKSTERLQRKVGRLQWKAVRASSWHVIVSEQVVEAPLILRQTVVSISTIEHLGLGGYGDVTPEQPYALPGIHLFSKVRPLGGWLPSNAAAAQDTVYEHPNRRLPTEAVALVACEKS
jgi:hypothetical protein